ncbi:hypothetical protein COT64_02110 [Candidatus Shapirobacteria bacterium CG09_land_8_20_14_0_10_39_12]|uniref:Tryptophan synthase beta chain-like PALP domain-containing protein n=1 Tax=Candidatus Shapirobacteria bacterium CG09_land_8_20_14_0_10_39_12 TaxID=1974885 RepID=A0A2H0WPG7_9BACT|nr:MAG: hypothetical protein COT64_02110 [Candidatus Shapirobacteria bacterium CG09_land_8_20_14_0_10_39_12]
MGKNKMKINLFRDKNQKGIWQFSSYLLPIVDQCKLSLNEGGTSEVALTENLILKREDQNPTGSLKDRGMAYLISRAFQDGVKSIVISSSGNAAISAASYCHLAKIKLTVFVSPKINQEKLAEINKREVEVIQNLRPLSEAVKFAKNNNLYYLRPSLSEFGPEGYQAIAFELAEKQGLVEDIFIPVSSGVALIGIAKGFKKVGFLPRLHVCQPSAICPISKEFDRAYRPEENNPADGIVARFSPLKDQVVSLIKESLGTGWVIGEEEIKKNQSVLKEKGIETSNEGALAFAGMEKAKTNPPAGGQKLGKTVILLTGRKYE